MTLKPATIADARSAIFHLKPEMQQNFAQSAWQKNRADSHKFQTSKTMTDNVIPIGKLGTAADIPTDKILDGAKMKQLVDAVVVGWDDTGKFAFFSTTADLKEVSWLLRHAELFVNDHIRAQDE